MLSVAPPLSVARSRTVPHAVRFILERRSNFDDWRAPLSDRRRSVVVVVVVRRRRRLTVPKVLRDPPPHSHPKHQPPNAPRVWLCCFHPAHPRSSVHRILDARPGQHRSGPSHRPLALPTRGWSKHERRRAPARQSAVGPLPRLARVGGSLLLFDHAYALPDGTCVIAVDAPSICAGADHARPSTSSRKSSPVSAGPLSVAAPPRPHDRQEYGGWSIMVGCV